MATPSGGSSAAPEVMSYPSTLGKLDEFKPEESSLSAYLERAQILFVANNVPEGKQVPVFLNALGAATYGILRDLLAPATPISQPFATITNTPRRHFEPRSLIVAERYHFHKRDQAPGETIALYVAELRRLASKCAFGGYLEEALRDRFVCGLRSEPTQRRLLSEADLTFDSAIDIAQNMEAAATNTQAMKNPTSSAPVEQVHIQATRAAATFPNNTPGSRELLPSQHTHTTSPPQYPYSSAPGSTSCFRCGSTAHSGNDCSYKHLHCHRCGKLGHIARACRRGRGARRPVRGGRGRAYWLQTQGEATQAGVEDDQVWDVLSIGSQAIVSPYKVTLLVNNQSLCMEIDTGAAVSLVSEATYKTLFPGLPLSKPALKLRTYTAEPITVLGRLRVRVKYKKYKGSHDLIVVQGSGPSLLGLDWLSCIWLDWAEMWAVRMQVNPGSGQPSARKHLLKPRPCSQRPLSLCTTTRISQLYSPQMPQPMAWGQCFLIGIQMDQSSRLHLHQGHLARVSKTTRSWIKRHCP